MNSPECIEIGVGVHTAWREVMSLHAHVLVLPDRNPFRNLATRVARSTARASM
jgi:hypothetical protein